MPVGKIDRERGDERVGCRGGSADGRLPNGRCHAGHHDSGHHSHTKKGHKQQADKKSSVSHSLGSSSDVNYRN